MTDDAVHDVQKEGNPVVAGTTSLPPISLGASVAMFAAVLGAMGGGPFVFSSDRELMAPEYKPCRHCGAPTTHKKQFCSGDCCRAYRSDSR